MFARTGPVRHNLQAILIPDNWIILRRRISPQSVMCSVWIISCCFEVVLTLVWKEEAAEIARSRAVGERVKEPLADAGPNIADLFAVPLSMHTIVPLIDHIFRVFPG